MILLYMFYDLYIYDLYWNVNEIISYNFLVIIYLLIAI